MAKRKKSEFRQATDAMFGGALALQGVKVISEPRTIANLTKTATGFVGIGITGALANMAFDMARGKAYPIRKKGKKKRR